jgi:hypothetical protein
VHALVKAGTVGFSSNGTDQVGLEIPEGIVSAANGQPAYGQVTILGPREVIISAYRGTLILDNEGELHAIPAGKSYRVTMDLEPAASTQPQEAAGVGAKDHDIVAPKKRHLAFDLIVLGVAGVGSYFIFREVSESPSRPK